MARHGFLTISILSILLISCTEPSKSQRGDTLPGDKELSVRTHKNIKVSVQACDRGAASPTAFMMPRNPYPRSFEGRFAVFEFLVTPKSAHPTKIKLIEGDFELAEHSYESLRSGGYLHRFSDCWRIRYEYNPDWNENWKSLDAGQREG